MMPKLVTAYFAISANNAPSIAKPQIRPTPATTMVQMMAIQMAFNINLTLLFITTLNLRNLLIIYLLKVSSE